jgi:penicillin-binding protein 2
LNIAENKNDLPGVSWGSKPIRNYLHTGSLSHIIGYVGDITKDEWTVLYNQGYT